jgi:valyl-tRNA synthetase
MIMMGLKFMGDVPFRDVYIHGLVRDAQGNKMSKSKGNVLDPIDLIDGIELAPLVEKRTRGLMQTHIAEKIAKQTRKDYPDGIPSFGTDALRFTFAALASTGRDIKFDLGRIEGYRNFCNKLWNAARFILMNTEGQDCGTDASAAVELTAADRWIRARLHATTAQVREALDNYRLDLAAQALYEFTWSQFCDWYLELCKPVLNNPEASEATKRGTRQTLVRTLEALLRLMHPIMPFITEEIWQKVHELAAQPGATIMLAPYPVADSSPSDAEADAKADLGASAEIDWVQAFILGVRRIKGEMNIAPGKPLPVLIANASATDRARLISARAYLDFLARTESITLLDDEQQAPEAAMALVGEMKLLIPMAGLIDKDAELARLDKDIAKLTGDIERIAAKLDNPNFRDKAPAAVVAKERQRLAEQQAACAQLSAQRERIREL